jgi:predicted TIM-barrel fold metal-dependent hydrolase
MTTTESTLHSTQGTPVDFQVFDADNHYYEATDAFIRHIEPEFRKRAMEWGQINGKQRLLVGGKVNRFIPNPTFDPVTKPGALDEYFRGRNPKNEGVRELFGELDPIRERPEYRDREARLAVMDAQGMQAAFFFPTLGVGMERALINDIPALQAAFRAFNRWLEEDWGFSYRDRIYAAPFISLTDLDSAITELTWALEHDARVVITGVGPVVTPAGGRAPSDPGHDAFWSLVNESGVTVALHGGDSYYSTYLEHWGQSSEMEAFRQNPLRALLSHDVIHDTVAAMLADGFFLRYPRIRLASIELGSTWVPHLFQKLKKSWGQTPFLYKEDPRETFRRHVWVSPYYEDDLAGLLNLVGEDRILMGSDWPHAEGLASPIDYIDDLRKAGYSAEACRKVMRTNGLELAARAS